MQLSGQFAPLPPLLRGLLSESSERRQAGARAVLLRVGAKCKVHGEVGFRGFLLLILRLRLKDQVNSGRMHKWAKI